MEVRVLREDAGSLSRALLRFRAGGLTKNEAAAELLHEKIYRALNAQSDAAVQTPLRVVKR